MVYRKLFSAALACAAMWPCQALADGPAMGLTISSPANGVPLSDQRLYKVTFRCSSLADLKNSSDANIFIKRNATSSHFIVINDKIAATDGSGNATFPTSGVAFLPVFAITKGVVKIDNRNSCQNTQYITGGPDLYLQTYASYSTQNEPGILLSLGYAVAGLIPPLWAMFNGNLSGPTKDQLTGAAGTEDPLKKMLGALNKDENYPASVNLRPGDYVVSTAFSRVRINVKYVPSIIKDAGPAAMKFFRKQIDTSQQKIDDANIAKCTVLAGDLLALGFSKQDDIPYALAYKGIRSGLTADQASQCLGDDYAVAAASIPGGLWEYAGKKEQVLTLDQAKADHPPTDPNIPYQAAFSATRMKVFTDDLSRLTRVDIMDPSDQTAFAKTLQEPVILDDKSVVKVFGGEAKNYTGSDLATYFVSKGYRRFGCYQATNLGEKLDGGKTLLFAFKADKDDTTLTVDGVTVVKPIFTDTGTVKKLLVYDDYDWINSVMTTGNWKCGRISIKAPAPATPVVATHAAPAG